MIFNENLKNNYGETKNKNFKGVLNKIRSNYILKRIFINLNKKKSLEVIQYNNKLQKKLNIEINDYMEYCENYSSIEIEIIPALNKYGKFINLHNKKDSSYIHIYFNDSQKKIKEKR